MPGRHPLRASGDPNNSTPRGKNPKSLLPGEPSLEPGIWEMLNPTGLQPFWLQVSVAPPIAGVWGACILQGQERAAEPTHKGRCGQGGHAVVAGAGSGVRQVAVGGLEAPL